MKQPATPSPKTASIIHPPHLLRLIEKHISFAFVREKLKESCSDTGQPSIGPELLLRILLIRYLYRITSERKLVEELRMHLAWHWFTIKQLQMKNFLYSVLGFAALAAIAMSWAAAPQRSDTTHPSAADDTGEGLSGLGPGGPQKCRQFKGDIICRVGGEVSVPKLIVPEQRDYQPPTLLSNSSNAGCPCSVVLWVVVGVRRTSSCPRVVRHVDAELDGMAIEWVKKWRFEPARKHDKPVAVETNLEVKFR